MDHGDGNIEACPECDEKLDQDDLECEPDGSMLETVHCPSCGDSFFIRWEAVGWERHEERHL